MRKRYENREVESDLSENFNPYELSKRKISIHSVSPIAGIIFLGLLFGIFVLVLLQYRILPKPLTIADEKDNPDAFITERARFDLKELTDIGPRIVGTYENEVLAVDLLKRKIASIQHQAHSSQKIELDMQTVSGSYFLELFHNGVTKVYGNVQNIIVKLHSRNNSEHSLLVNAHFDSVPTSPGGSDDGINCATMLEVLRKISRLPEQPLHNIIFLFNGAEETGLQAAHGFITQHKWAKEVGVVINLEAAGAGGKEILFQAGPGQPWLLNYYTKVPHPNGQAFAEELFQGGVIPSDTDFRIFRDFGNTVGLDLAFNRDGYRYHTSYDDFSNIPLGSYQHVGDNALYLVRTLANAPELADPKGQPEENFVFFDYLGLFVIIYSETATIVINTVVSILSLVIALKSFYDFELGLSFESLKYLGLTTTAIVMGWVAAIAFVVAVASFIDAVKFSMSWYNNSWILFGLYVVPTITCCCGLIAILNHFYSKNNLSISVQTQIQAHLMRLIWTVPLLIGTFLGIRSVYQIFMPLLFQTLTAAVILIFSLQYSIRKWQIIYLLGTIIPNIFLMRVAEEFLGFFISICGRIGPDKNSELILGALTLTFTIVVTTYYVPLITLVRKPSLLLATLGGIFLLFFAIVFTPLGFPYSDNTESPAPQRFWIYHTSRIFRNDTNDIFKNDAGFFIINMDRNSPDSVKQYVKDLNNTESIAEDCKLSLFCGLPLATSKVIDLLPESTWIPAEQPILTEPINLKLNSKTSISTNSTMRYNFTATGPNRFVIYVSPKTDVELTNMSLLPEVESEPAIWNGRPIYIIVYNWGKESTPLTFTLDFKTLPIWNRTTFDIALTGTYKNDKTNNKTAHFKQFLSEFPSWTNVAPWLGAYESWVY